MRAIHPTSHTPGSVYYVYLRTFVLAERELQPEHVEPSHVHFQPRCGIFEEFFDSPCPEKRSSSSPSSKLASRCRNTASAAANPAVLASASSADENAAQSLLDGNFRHATGRHCKLLGVTSALPVVATKEAKQRDRRIYCIWRRVPHTPPCAQPRRQSPKAPLSWKYRQVVRLSSSAGPRRQRGCPAARLPGVRL